MSDRFVVLGLARSRASWFSAVGHWTHAGSLAAEFVKCLSAEELRVRLSTGRLHSAVLLDGELPAVDRDLIHSVHRAGAAALVIDSAHAAERWLQIGADAVLPGDLSAESLSEALLAHAAMVPRGEWPTDTPTARATPAGAPGRLIAICGPGGTGASTIAIALAQEFAHDRDDGAVVLADFCLRAEQAMLHDAADGGPGVQELVELCRTASPDRDQVRRYTFAVTERGYALLLGLRQARAWSALRPRSIAVAIDGLRRAFDVVVVDCDADVEGEAQSGSLDVEERNALSRAALSRADAAVVVGSGGLKGLHSLARAIDDLRDVGVAPERVIAVVNRAPRSPRQRSHYASALRELVGGTHQVAAIVSVGERPVDDALHDRRRVPAALAEPLLPPLAIAMTGPAGPPIATDDGARRIAPGSLGAFAEGVVTS
jgi:MinD-like ATPase involved in chromosome partitioning or flagellar assembly